jgi:hypothetical protein
MQSVVQRVGAMLENKLKEHAVSFCPLVPFLDLSVAEHGAGEWYCGNQWNLCSI